MKRIISAILAGIMLVGMAGCQQEADVTTTGPVTTAPPSVADPTTQPTPTTVPTEPTTVPTEPETEPTQPPVESEPEEGLREERLYDEAGTLRRLTQYLGDQETNVWIYDHQGRLTSRELYGCYHLDTVIRYAYDDQGDMTEVDYGDYSYTMDYDDQGNMIRRTRWEDGLEDGCQVFTYTDGILTGETFWQDEQRKYTYRFDASGALTGHVTYVDGVAVETEDPGSLVRVQLPLDVWMPITDNCPKSFSFDYDGTALTRKEGHVDSSWEITYDGSYYRPLQGWFDEDYETGEIIHEHIYRDGQRVETVMREDGVEFARYTYVNDQWGRPVEEVRYEDGQEVYRCQYRYGEDGTVETLTQWVDEEPHSQIEHHGPVEEQLPQYDGYVYTFDEQGVLQECFIYYDDWFAGTALFDCRVVYVPAVEAESLHRIWTDMLFYM